MKEVIGEVLFRQVEPYAYRALAGESVTFEAQHHMEGGTIRFSLNKFVPYFDNDNHIIGLFVLGLNITDLKNAELEIKKREHDLRLITNNIPGFISRVDRNLTYLYVNDQYEKYFNKPREWIIGRTLPEVIGWELYQTAAPYVKEVLSGKHTSFETQHWDGSGNLLAWLISFVPDVDQEKNVIGFFTFGIDITDRKLTELALIEKEQELQGQRHLMEESFRTYVAGQTASAIAHELNQPLSACSYFADAAVSMLENSQQNSEELSDVLQKCSEQA